MGGAVSSGRDNAELIDNLMGGNYIRSRDVERVFRALDRGDYMTPEARDQAYKDLAWRNGPLHMSAPCIYSEVMEGLELRTGLTFLNVGSGTGYFSTLVGLILGSNGINHGVEVHPIVVDYANKKLAQFLDSSPTLDEFDFCEPKFFCGNGLCLAPLQVTYDRVYCGAGCPEEYQNYFQQLIRVGGILIMPLNDNLLQVKRTGPTEWATRSLLNVSFASLRVPTREEQGEVIRLEEHTPARLQVLARSVIRECMRGSVRRRNPQLLEPPARGPPAKRSCPRRICIPVDEDSDPELNGFHDMDRAGGANEMNALLNLVLSMGHNRVAGSLRADPRDSGSETSSSYDPGVPDHELAPDDAGRRSPTLRIVNVDERSGDGNPEGGNGNRRSMLMFEFSDRRGFTQHNSPFMRHNPPYALRRAVRNRRRWQQRGLRARADHPAGPDGVQEDFNDYSSYDSESNDESDRRDRPGDGDRLAEQEGNETLENVPEDNESDVKDGLNDSKAETNDEVVEEIKSNDLEDKIDDKEVAIEKDVNLKNDKVILEGDEVTEEKLLKSEDENALLEDKDDTAQEKQSSSNDGQSTSGETPRPAFKRREQRRTSRPSGRDKDKVCKTRRRPRTAKAYKHPSEEKEDEEEKPAPEVPAEVEICLKESSDKAGTSMEWETSDTVEDEAKSDDDEESNEMVKAKEEKRQKLDSGLGEENSPSGGSGSHKSVGTEPEPDHTSDSCDSDRSDYDEVRGRRVRQKRGHLSTRSSSSTEGEDEIERDENGQYFTRRSRKPRTDHHATRRAALSLLMKQAVKELPLPHVLQRYVNMGRSFDI